MVLDGAFNVAGSILLIRAFLQQEFPGWKGAVEGERPFALTGRDTFVHFFQFEIQDLPQMFLCQSPMR